MFKIPVFIVGFVNQTLTVTHVRLVSALLTASNTSIFNHDLISKDTRYV
jgi:hypothetical protein